MSTTALRAFLRPLSPCLAQLLVNDLLESAHRAVSEQFPVDEEGGCAGYAGGDAVRVILPYFLDDLGLRHLLLERLFIQFQLLRYFPHRLVVEPVVILEKQIVELPELPLAVGGQRRNRRLHGEFVILQREILEHTLYLFRILPEHLLE